MHELQITTNGQGSLVVASTDFAAGLEIQHKNLLETIRTHQQAIEQDFGLIAFETRKVDGRGRPESFAYLTEDQALFIGTLSRNSKRVVEFKSVLVKSFADARRNMTAPALPSTTEQVLLQLVAQSQQILSNQQEQLAQLRADVDSIIQGGKPPKRNRAAVGRQLAINGMPTGSAASSPALANLRSLIHQRVTEYCQIHGATSQETYNYLYKRMYEVYSISVYRLARLTGESILDALGRYGHLERLYSLVRAELDFSEYEQ